MTTRHEGGTKDDKVDKATYITSTLGRNGNIYPRASRKRPETYPLKWKVLSYTLPDAWLSRCQ